MRSPVNRTEIPRVGFVQTLTFFINHWFFNAVRTSDLLTFITSFASHLPHPLQQPPFPCSSQASTHMSMEYIGPICLTAASVLPHSLLTPPQRFCWTRSPPKDRRVALLHRLGQLHIAEGVVERGLASTRWARTLIVGLSGELHVGQL